MRGSYKLKKLSLRAIKTPKQQNIELHIFVRDNEYVAHYVAKEFNIPLENVHYSLNPKDNIKVMANLHQNAKHLAFGADGIDDTVELEWYNVGLSIGDNSMDNKNIPTKITDEFKLIGEEKITQLSMGGSFFCINNRWKCIYLRK